MADYREQIPGWLDAVAVERYEHDAAFSNPVDVIAGFPVRHMSLLDATQLVAMGCPLVGSMPDEDLFLTSKELHQQAAVMIAFLHPDFRRNRGIIQRIKNRRRIRAALKVRPASLFDELSAYNERTFMDGLGGNGRKELISQWSTVTDYIDLIASQYGWGREEIISMPFRQLIQFCRRIVKRTNPDAPIPSLGDQCIAAHTRKLNAAQNP